MRKLGICEEERYARRLTEYLIRSLPGDFQVHCFSSPQKMLDYKGRIDLYLVGEDCLAQIGDSDFFSGREILIISGDRRDGTYCRWDNPRELIKELEVRFTQSFARQKVAGEREIIAVYTPFPIDLRRYLWPYMEEGSLYLGLEDMGPQGRKDMKDMGELCYFIHIQEEDILEEMDRLVNVQDGKCYLDSPQWYFDFIGLGEQDFRWFCEKLKKGDQFRKIYIGLGSAMVPSLSFFQIFDRLILLEADSISQGQRFCEKLERTLVDQRLMDQACIERRKVGDIHELWRI